MQILCEGHPRILGLSAGMRFVSHPPHVCEEPVLVGETFIDDFGCSIYGSVLHDGGRFRMWYQAWAQENDGTDSLCIGCVESDDGIHWTRPSHGLIERGGSRDNHLTGLPLHAPSVIIDPHVDDDRRYRAFGYHVPSDGRGYYTAHSADGLRWTIEPCPYV